MCLSEIRFSFSRRFCSFTILLCVLFLISSYASVARGAAQEQIYQKWELVSSLRARGEFNEAIQLLNNIINQYSESDDILKRAYNHIVFTFLLMKEDASAIAQAREGLEQFADLVADPVEFPPRVNEIYNQLRSEMFGTLEITKPGDCRVFLGEEFKGETPLKLDLIRIGSYELMVTKSGYYDYKETIRIDPSGKHILEVSMDRRRNKRWWFYRIGPAVAAGIILAVTLGGAGGEGAPQPEPLPEPPAPPGQ
ncbi:MAG: PEGA domain-containing protein [bacterium]|nr:MAG: PEGA domain-containing protein [bacterium]